LGVIPLGIDLREFPERPHPRPAGVFALVYLGRLEARKNVGFLFALLPKILSAGCTRIRLTIVGEGPLRSRLEAEARARGVGHVVHFAGPIPPTAVPAALQRYHVLLHPSLRESFGYTLLEAKASGVQTVATAGLEVPGDFIDHPLPLDSTLWAQAVTGAYRSWEGNGFLLPSPESLAGLRRRYSAERMVGDYLAVLRGEPVPGDSPDQPGAGSFEGPPRRPASATVPLMRS
jgi:glycosyltransferase involved in cell wall biosynthesis